MEDTVFVVTMGRIRDSHPRQVIGVFTSLHRLRQDIEVPWQDPDESGVMIAYTKWFVYRMTPYQLNKVTF